jgi:hypothetical protein
MSLPTFQKIHTLQRTATKARSNGRDATNLSGAFMVIYISVYRINVVVRSPRVLLPRNSAGSEYRPGYGTYGYII